MNINEYIRAHREDMLRDLRYLVSFPSVNTEPAEHAPFGKVCAECLKASGKLFEREGFCVELHEDKGYAMVYTKPEEKDAIGLFAHSDVVPVTDQSWLITEPFTLLEKDGYVFGRGVSDDKGAIITVLYIMKAFRECEISPKHGISFFIGSNEETGMDDIDAFASEQPMPKVSLSPDGGFPASLGEKGIMRFDVLKENAFKTVLSVEGGTAYNIVMPIVKCAVKAADGLVNELKAINKDWLSFTDNEDTVLLEVSGVACHGAHPSNGVSAFKRLCDVLSEVDSFDADDKRVFQFFARILSDTNGTALGIACEDDAFGALTVANGIVSTINGTLRVGLDIRFGTGITDITVKQKLTSAAEAAGMKVETISNSVGFRIPDDDKFAVALLDTYKKATGESDAKLFHMSGGTYCKHLRNAFATGYILNKGIMPPYLPSDHGHGHQPDECMNIEAYLSGTAVVAEMILALDKLI